MKIPEEMLDCSAISKVAFERALAELTSEDYELPFSDGRRHLGYVHALWNICSSDQHETFFHLFLKYLITR